MADTYIQPTKRHLHTRTIHTKRYDCILVRSMTYLNTRCFAFPATGRKGYSNGLKEVWRGRERAACGVSCCDERKMEIFAAPGEFVFSLCLSVNVKPTQRRNPQSGIHLAVAFKVDRPITLKPPLIEII